MRQAIKRFVLKAFYGVVFRYRFAILLANQSQHFHLKQAPKIFENTPLDQQAGFEIVTTLDIIDLHLILGIKNKCISLMLFFMH